MSTIRLSSVIVSLSIFLGGCISVASPTLATIETIAPTAAPEKAGPMTSGTSVACPELDPHPIAASIAEDFDTPYEDVVEWFCSGHTFEDILLALQTEKLAAVDAAALLAEREQGKMWSAIWAEEGITAP